MSVMSYLVSKWDVAHMQVAETYAQLSSAKRAQVGAVIVKDNRIISIGYNGMPSGWVNKCEDYVTVIGDDGEPSIGMKTKPEVLHAEANAITKVARSSESTLESTIYCTMQPCLECAKLIYQSGITKVVYSKDYPKGSLGTDFLDKCGIEIIKL